MANRPKTAAGASALGTIGGIITVTGMAYNLHADGDTLMYIGLYLLVAILFFSSAGFLYWNGKSNYPSLIFIELLNIAVIMTSIALETDFKNLGTILAVIAVLIALLSIPESVRKWIAWDRL
ncbi:MAG: hypothetical protein MJY64_00660 [archaeon]|nr:hypothetical protein [archaeon]